jgi:hypothetical protein
MLSPKEASPKQSPFKVSMPSDVSEQRGFTVTKGRQHTLHCAFKNMGTPPCVVPSPCRRYDIPYRSCIQFSVVARENLYNFEKGEHFVLV